MKIYFAASVTDKTANIRLYNQIIKHLTLYGMVLNEKIGNKNFWKKRQKIAFSKEQAHDFDLKLLLESDVVVAEITIPSLGVGYELGRAVEKGKSVLCLYNKQSENKISAMIMGSCGIVIRPYETLSDIKLLIKEYFNSLSQEKDKLDKRGKKDL